MAKRSYTKCHFGELDYKLCFKKELPFKTVENQDFHEIIQYVTQGRYNQISVQAMSRSLIPKIYEVTSN